MAIAECGCSPVLNDSRFLIQPSLSCVSPQQKKRTIWKRECEKSEQTSLALNYLWCSSSIGKLSKVEIINDN